MYSERASPLRRLGSATLGLLDARDPEFAMVKMHSKVQGNQPESSPAERTFDWISSDKACQLIIKQMAERSSLERLKAAQEYDTQPAAEALKKAMDKGPV